MRRGLRRSVLVLVAAAACFAWAVGNEASARGFKCKVCVQPCVQPCVTYKTVEKVVHVPQIVTERRRVRQVVCRPEVREKTVTVLTHVPETRTVTREFTAMVPERRVREVRFTVRKPVVREVTKEVTVLVPHREVREGVRRVCRMVPVEETRVVCRDAGQWVTRGCPVPCGHGVCAHRVWVPKIVTEEVPVTVMRPQMVEEPFEHTVVVCRPEVRTKTFRVCDFELVEQVKEVPFTVCIPVRQTRTFDVTRMVCVPEERVVRHTVMVPHTVEREVDVQVCRMVAKRVLHKVPVVAPCPPCPGC